MLSNNDPRFYIPPAGLLRTDSSTMTNASAFSHMHLVSNPDWMSSLSANQQVAAARPARVPPAPVAVRPSAPQPLAVPVAIGTPAAAAKKSFLDIFYRSSSTAAPSKEMSQQASSAAFTLMSVPPKALDVFDTPPLRALPVDAQLPMEYLSKLDKVDATISAAPRHVPPRPMALGSDTWNALSSVPLPPKTKTRCGPLLAPPISIDGVSSGDPTPSWKSLFFSSRFRGTAPTLEAFQNAPPEPIRSTSPGSPHHWITTTSTTTVATAPIPVPPKPVTGSPLRGATVRSLEAGATAAMQVMHHEPRTVAHPLVPVGEDTPAVVKSVLKPVQQAPVISTMFVNPAPNPVSATSPAKEPAPLSLTRNEPEQVWLPEHVEESVSPLPKEFTKSIAGPTMEQAQRDEARTLANVRNFISTLFSGGRDGETDSSTTENKKADGFSALEFVMNRRGTQAKASQPADYSSFFNTSFFDDDCDEDSEEGLEKLRRVISIVMQSAKNHDGNSVSAPISQSCCRGEGGDGTGVVTLTPFPSKYTEFSASYQTTSNNANDNEWRQFAQL
uniref:Uncharacterized protein n=1 Tax=Leishmania guyanensis TaxID=5670 RepID=A0A1E1J9E8_LEIGU|nr:hypothetical protein, conserved [Leishmania guyanensis]